MDKTYFQRFVIEGGIIMVFLIPCAFLAVAFMVQNAINLRKSKIFPLKLLKKVRSAASAKEVHEILKSLKTNPSPFARIINLWIKKKEGLNSKDTDELLRNLTDDEIARLYHKNNQLTTIYQISPLLGLLGTVIGMLKTFYDFSMEKEHSIEMLSKGINEALITTVWGLMIAIPAYVVLHQIKQKLFRYESDSIPAAAEEISDLLDKYGIHVNEKTTTSANIKSDSATDVKTASAANLKNEQVIEEPKSEEKKSEDQKSEEKITKEKITDANNDKNKMPAKKNDKKKAEGSRK